MSHVSTQILQRELGLSDNLAAMWGFPNGLTWSASMCDSGPHLQHSSQGLEATDEIESHSWVLGAYAKEL